MSMTLLELAAKLTLDDSEFNNQIGNAQSAFSKVGSIAKVGFRVATAAVGAAAVAAGALAKSAVEGYAEFEQLEGGVKKLYGNMGKSLEDYAEDNGKTTAEVKDQWQALEDAQNQVLSDANEAYKTAGLSANDYMETATSFSASLINSLGGDTMKAAEKTKVAMVAISDNVNTFGTNMEDVTNAFKGFSKQNYTMLDNLKLGYGGTKTEMERLIADANEWGAANGEAADLSIDSFADVVEAIQRIQEKQNIAGTTMREGTTTIEGSINMTKAAWENLVSSLGNSEADIGQLITNVVDSAMNVFDNVIPIAQQALASIGTLVTEAIPRLAERIPGIVSTLLPAILSAATSLLSSIAEAIPALFQGIKDAISLTMGDVTGGIDITQFLTKGAEMADNVWNGFQSTLSAIDVSGLYNTATSWIDTIINGITTVLPMITSKGLEISSSLLEGITQALPSILNGGVQILTQIVNGILQNLPTLLTAAGTMIAQFVGFVMDNLPTILSAGVQMLLNLVNGIIDNLPELAKAAVKIVLQLITTIVSHLPELLLKGVAIVIQLVAGLIKAIPKIIATIPKLIKAIVTGLIEFDWLGVGKNIIDGIVNGVKAVAGALKDAIVGIAKGALDAVKKFFGIASPSRVMRDQVGKYVALGMAQGIDDYSDTAVDAMKDASRAVSDAATLSVNSDLSATGTGVAGYGGASGVTINVYGAEGQSAKDIAEKVADIINNNIYRQRAVFA